MEEMTIQEKARRYDESIERARKLKENPKAIFFEEKNVHVSDYIFPELQENKDERIREAIYKCVEWFDFGLSFFRYAPKEECLAWLEKQGEKGTNGNEREIPNSTWSEEDTERYISCLQHLGTGNLEQPETINSKWFKEHIKIPAQVQSVIAL